MSRDPYQDVKGEVETNIQNVENLLASHYRIRAASSDPSAIAETIDELQATLGLLEADLQDLEESVRMVEGHGDRWGIDIGEVRQRRGFVDRVAGEVERLRAKVRDVVGKGTGRNKRQKPGSQADVENQPSSLEAEEAERWEREEQQVNSLSIVVCADREMLMRRQDDTLGVISGTLTSLASQAGLIGHEVADHSEMLDDLSTRVDTTQSRLGRVSKTMQDFIRKNEDTRSSWCIGILIIILIILLVLVLLT